VNNEQLLVGQGARGRTGILLVHSLSGTPKEMRLLARSLNLQGYTVLTVTLAGHGGTREHLVNTSWLDWLASVRRGADLLASRVDRLVVGGFSTGAVLALALAQERPLHVAGVLALSPAFRHDGRDMPRYARLAFLMPVLRALGIGQHRVFAERSLPMGQPGTPWWALPQMRKLTASVLRRMNLLRAPCLVMHARHDDIASVSNAFEIVHRACNTNVSLQLLADSPHLITMGRERREVIARVAAFVNGIAEAPALQGEALRA
jgi:carboxylesterase